MTLIAITLTLATNKDLLPPQYVGRANYAATLNRLNTHSNRQGTPIKAGKPYFARVTGSLNKAGYPR